VFPKLCLKSFEFYGEVRGKYLLYYLDIVPSSIFLQYRFRLNFVRHNLKDSHGHHVCDHRHVNNISYRIWRYVYDQSHTKYQFIAAYDPRGRTGVPYLATRPRNPCASTILVATLWTEVIVRTDCYNNMNRGHYWSTSLQQCELG
jgi:hypothetical protein